MFGPPGNQALSLCGVWKSPPLITRHPCHLYGSEGFSGTELKTRYIWEIYIGPLNDQIYISFKSLYCSLDLNYHQIHKSHQPSSRYHFLLSLWPKGIKYVEWCFSPFFLSTPFSLLLSFSPLPLPLPKLIFRLVSWDRPWDMSPVRWRHIQSTQKLESLFFFFFSEKFSLQSKILIGRLNFQISFCSPFVMNLQGEGKKKINILQYFFHPKAVERL